MGQTPSSQNAQYKTYVQKPKHDRRVILASSHVLAADSDLSLFNNARTLRNPRNRTRSLRASMLRKANESDRAFFCLICDRSFSSNDYLQEHLAVHDSDYSMIPTSARKETVRYGRARLSVEAWRSQCDPNTFCRVCDKPFGCDRLVNHFLLAELHRDLRNRNELHQTTDRPELWCAICKTRFTHTDRKRKHMEELNEHNTRYRELQSRAVHDPNFDHSIFERPRPPPLSNVNITVEAESIHFCAPCDRYFSSARQLEQHQSEGQCDSRVTGPSHLVRHGLPSSSLLTSTQSETDLPLPPPPPPDKDDPPSALRAACSTANLRSSSPVRATLECALCLEQEDNVSALVCGHIFGTTCIRNALKDDARCPLCRTKAAATDLRRVFLS